LTSTSGARASRSSPRGGARAGPRSRPLASAPMAPPRHPPGELPGRVILTASSPARAFVPMDDYSLMQWPASLGEGRPCTTRPAEEILRLFEVSRPRLSSTTRPTPGWPRTSSTSCTCRAGVERSRLTGMPSTGLLSIAASTFSTSPSSGDGTWSAPSVRTVDAIEPGGRPRPGAAAGLYRNVLVLDFKSSTRASSGVPDRPPQPDPLGSAPRAGPIVARTARPSPAAADPHRDARRDHAPARPARRPGTGKEPGLKILMNSFYGVLGPRPAASTTPGLANAITSFGRRCCSGARGASRRAGGGSCTATRTACSSRRERRAGGR